MDLQTPTAPTAERTAPSPWAVEHVAESRRWLEANGIDFPQNDTEFAWLLDRLRQHGVRSILEIGSRAGGSAFSMVTAMQIAGLEGLRLLCVDLPGARWGFDASRASLLRVIEELRSRGVEADVIFGDSHDPAVRRSVAERLGGPVDFGFIDGDHTYGGVRSDWLDYGGLIRPGGLAGFHDIFVPDDFPDKTFGVPRFWQELREVRRTEERVEMWGIGLVRLAAPGAGQSEG